MTTRDTDDRFALLEEEATRLRAANFELEGRMRAQEEQGTSRRRDDGPAPRMSWSRVLRMGGGAAAAGAVAAGASGLLSARPAAATTGNPLLIGILNNFPTTPADTTRLLNPSGTELSPLLFRTDNFSSPASEITLPGARIAAAGTTSGPDTAALPKVGLRGQTDDANINGAGVVGRGGTTGADPLVFGGSPAGVIGTARDGGVGLLGMANGTFGVGVDGRSDAGFGVIGNSTTGSRLPPSAGAGCAKAFCWPVLPLRVVQRRRADPRRQRRAVALHGRRHPGHMAAGSDGQRRFPGRLGEHAGQTHPHLRQPLRCPPRPDPSPPPS